MQNAIVQNSTVTSDIVAPVIVIKPATQAQVDSFCLAILNGKSTAKILPASITDLKANNGLTVAQQEQIKAARKTHEFACDDNRKALFELANKRRVKGARFNKDGELTGLRFADKYTKYSKNILTK